MNPEERKRLLKRLKIVRKTSAPASQIHKRKNKPKRKSIRMKLRYIKERVNSGQDID